MADARTVADATVAERLVDAVRELTVLAGAGFGSDAQARRGLERLGRARRLLDAVAVQVSGEIDRLCEESNLAVRWGERSAAGVVAAVAGVDDAEARAWCTVGAAIRPRMTLTGQVLEPQHPGLAAAVPAAELPVSRLARIADTIQEVEQRVPGQGGPLTGVLLGAAAGLTSREFARVCRHTIQWADADGVEPREAELRRRRGVQVAHLPDGMLRWIVTMDPESAGFLTAALDARTAPRREPHFATATDTDDRVDVPDDGRTLPQRRLDALVGIARSALRADDGAVAGTDVTMLVTVPLEALRSGTGAGQIEGVDLPISAGTARRLAAAADIVPAVLGGQSEPLDLGRAARLFSRAQRRALTIRDGGCLWPGCTAPPGWCEVAHITPWSHGGPTDLDNAMLLCPFHHRRFDLDGWTLQVRDGCRWLIPPPSIDAGRTPHRLTNHRTAHLTAVPEAAA